MKLFAQPYSVDADGFYFDSLDDYEAKADVAKDRFGQPVEEFEIQMIDGEDIEVAVAKAMGINQANLPRFFELIDDYDEDDLLKYAIAVGEGGYSDDSDPGQLDISVYEGVSMKELAEQFVDEGLYGEIPDPLVNYIDYEAIARDLRFDYSEANVAGRDLIYRLS